MMKLRAGANTEETGEAGTGNTSEHVPTWLIENGVASPGRGAEGGEQLATEVSQNARHKEQVKSGDEDYDGFKPLVIDTHTDKNKMASVEDKEKKAFLLQQAALYRENNPSDVEDESELTLENGPQRSVTPMNLSQGLHSNCSTPSESRVHSPALSTTSNSGGTSKSGNKVSMPQKARKKTDKIQPVNDTGDKYACPICQKILISNTELTKHIRSHNNGAPIAANSCTICGKVLSSQSSLDRHMLVHSGERPFKCKYCTMAFTTNGNMHRHMRIHEKEGGQSSFNGDQSRSNTKSSHRGFSSLETPYSQVGFSNPLVKQMRDLTPTGSKRKLVYEESYLSQLPAKRSAFSIPPSMTAEFIMLSPGGRAVNTTTPSPPQSKSEARIKQEVGEEEEAKEYGCPSCPKKFVCKYALQTHLATHPDVMFDCSLCPRSFNSSQELNIHKLDDHQSHAPDTKPRSLNLSETDRTEKSVKGFHPLTFTDFTLQKFPLIAQAWCDKSKRQASSIYHDFTCKICQKAFPCQSALDIHKLSHTQENVNECRNCKVVFADSKQLTDHMLSHTGCKAVARVAKSEGGQDKPQEIITQEEFMASFGMKIQSMSSSPLSSSQNKEGNNFPFGPDEGRGEKRINRDYYPLLQRHYMSMYPHLNPHILHKTNGSSDRMAPNHDLADIQQILSRFGTGGGLVHTGINDHYTSPYKASGATQSFNKSNGKGSSESRDLEDQDLTMRLPVMVENGFVPIYNEKDQDQRPECEVFRCTYCQEVFNDSKIFSAHMKTHLGAAPYRCNLCPYASADKSTHVRHLRTHSGERPFNCTICKFSFTTRANCERHIRKKHEENIEGSVDNYIVYEKSTIDAQRYEEMSTTSDSTCKQCGIDFKEIRALKRHHRTNSPCSPKPFLCKLCDNCFSSRESCLRHISKTHTEIGEEKAGEYVHLREHLASKVLQDNFRNFENSQSYSIQNNISNKYQIEATKSNTPIVISPVPHLNPVLPHPVSKSSTMITSPPILDFSRAGTSTDKVAKEREESEEQPLDFSMKPTSQTNSEPLQVNQINIEPCHMSGGQAFERTLSSEQPMDLTVRASPEPSSHDHKDEGLNGQSQSTPSPSTIQAAKTLSDLPPEIAARTLPQLLVSPTAAQDYGMLRYKKEYQKYYNASVGKLQCPYCKMLFKHGLKVHIRSHTNERPFTCCYCSASFTIKTNLERHLKKKHPEKPAFIPEENDSYVNQPENMSKVESSDEVKNEPQKTPDSNTHQTINNGSDDSNCELSSVNRILDVTSANSFQNLLSAVRSEQTTPEKLTPIPTPFTQYITTSDKKEIELGDESDLDEGVITVQSHLPNSASLLTNGTDGLLIRKIRNPKVAENNDDPSSPAKKKRNSYADSPHKLICPFCPRAFPWISSLNRHILTHTGQKPFKCPQCGVMFSTKSNRERHLVRKHGLNVLDPATRQLMDRPYKCHLCVFSSFSTAGNLAKHYREKHPEVPVPDHLHIEAEEDNNKENDAYAKECQENTCAAEAMKAKKLEFCDEDEDSKDEHQDIVSPKSTDPLPSANSNNMNGNASRSSTPTFPRAVSPAPTPPGTPERQHINPEKDNYNADKITECWKCNEDFSTRKNLLRHLKEHAIDLPFKCYLCDASYNSRLESLEHVIERHASDWLMLKDKNQVTDVEEFADCLNRLVEQNFIGNNNDGKKLTEAELIKYKVHLNDDMKPESDYAQRKVYCSLCPKRFWSLQDLRRHMRSHTGERPFECDICQKRFTLKHSMMRHRRKHADAANSPHASDEEIGNGLDNSVTMVSESKKQSVSVSGIVSCLGGASQGALSSDLLHNLLGVDDTDIDELLQSGSADKAARMLGVQQEN